MSTPTHLLTVFNAVDVPDDVAFRVIPPRMLDVVGVSSLALR